MTRRLIAAIFAVAAVLLVAAPPAGAFGPPKTIRIVPNCGPGGYYKLVTATGRVGPLDPINSTFQVVVQGTDPILEIQPPPTIFTLGQYGDTYVNTGYVFMNNLNGDAYEVGFGPPTPAEINPHAALSLIIVKGSPAAPPLTQDVVIAASSGCNKP